MKRIFLILWVTLIQATTAWSVSLPSHSYIMGTSHTTHIEASSTLSTGSIIRGTYVSTDVSECDYPGEPTLCANCCQTPLTECSNSANGNQANLSECFRQYLSCVNNCETGRSLPLTGGEPFLLLLASVFYVLKYHYRNNNLKNKPL